MHIHSYAYTFAARLLAKFHPEAAIIAVSGDKHICAVVEGYLCNAFAVLCVCMRACVCERERGSMCVSMCVSVCECE